MGFKSGACYWLGCQLDLEVSLGIWWVCGTVVVGSGVVRVLLGWNLVIVAYPLVIYVGF